MGTAIDDSKVMTAPSDIKTQLSVLVLRLAEAQELLQEQR